MLFWRVALWCLVILLFGTSGTGLPINDIYIYLQPSKKKKDQISYILCYFLEFCSLKG